MKSTRRKFIANTTRITAAAGLSALIPAASKAARPSTSANDKIIVALIGARNMGYGILSHAINQPGVECAAICDIDDRVLNEKTEDVYLKTGKRPQQHKDFRKLLENKDIDAVIVGTPDHWHCLAMVNACQAGKDVYVEKPMANSIGECDVMVKAARKYSRVVQVGQQQRSGAMWQEVMRKIKDGDMGQLRKVQIWANFNYGVGRPKMPDSPVPAGVDFDMWLGPAPDRTFNETRFHGSWRMFWDYGGGLMTDWGVHLIDMALWAGDVNDPPVAALSSGGNFSHPDHAHETFDTMSVSWQMKDYAINWEHTAGTQNGPYGRLYGLAFIGNDATIVVDRGGWEIFPELENGRYKVPAMPAQGSRGETHEEHVKNWLECIKSRKDPNCTVETGRNVALYAHMANISLRSNTRVEWDPVGGDFGKNKAAMTFFSPEYRKPWELPKI
ncbi:MAG: Gfo/Idh/MocA family oxidoreductase [Cyclobacteriaceae bacterium]|nr:Gfo/Idh/MocA family oxidoreductase [Cyclobacteriaceae bacterium]